jgi:hypothetical protein
MDQRRIWSTNGILLECDDWTLCFRPIKYENATANAMAPDSSEAKTVSQYVTTFQR